MNNNKIGQGEVIEITYPHRRPTTPVHVRLWLNQHYLFPLPQSVAHEREKRMAREPYIPPLSQGINDVKTDIMTGTLVFWARVAKTDNNSHSAFASLTLWQWHVARVFSYMP
jgi:hypothetical protein